MCPHLPPSPATPYLYLTLDSLVILIEYAFLIPLHLQWQFPFTLETPWTFTYLHLHCLRHCLVTWRIWWILRFVLVGFSSVQDGSASPTVQCVQLTFLCSVYSPCHLLLLILQLQFPIYSLPTTTTTTYIFLYSAMTHFIYYHSPDSTQCSPYLKPSDTFSLCPIPRDGQPSHPPTDHPIPQPYST